jgi:hypothetical protein
MRLRPPGAAGADPPPFVLVRRREGLPALEEGVLVFREEDVALYRRP